jgi:hypothetical protein
VVSSKPSLEEREMTINIIQNEDGEWTAELYTNIHKYANRCIRQGWKQVNETTHKDGTWISAQFTAPAKAISIGKAVRPKRVVSEEQKQAAKERMQKWRKTKNNEN